MTVVDHLRQLQPAPSSVLLWWFGQESVALKGQQTVVLVDPFFSAHPQRLVPPPAPPDAFDCVDLVLITHEHLDHFDPPSCHGIATASPQAQFVCPEQIVEQLRAAGVPAERVHGARPGTSLTVSGVRIWPVAAKHGIHAADAYGFGAGPDGVPRFLGYVVELEGVRIYHAGDTIPYDGMVEALRALSPDLALLPINGRDYFREQQDIVGNLTVREAAQLAAAIGVQALVPLHYDLFAPNQADPGHLVSYVRQHDLPFTVIVPPHHQPFCFRPVRTGEEQRR